MKRIRYRSYLLVASWRGRGRGRGNGKSYRGRGGVSSTSFAERKAISHDKRRRRRRRRQRQRLAIRPWNPVGFRWEQKRRSLLRMLRRNALENVKPPSAARAPIYERSSTPGDRVANRSTPKRGRLNAHSMCRTSFGGFVG